MTWKPALTDHELAALCLLSRGHTFTQIVAALEVELTTVGRLLNRARCALHARTLYHAVARAYELGILPA